MRFFDLPGTRYAAIDVAARHIALKFARASPGSSPRRTIGVKAGAPVLGEASRPDHDRAGPDLGATLLVRFLLVERAGRSESFFPPKQHIAAEALAFSERRAHLGLAL